MVLVFARSQQGGTRTGYSRYTTLHGSLGKTAGSGSGRLAVVQPRPVLSLVANFIWFWEGPYNGPCGLSYFTTSSRVGILAARD